MDAREVRPDGPAGVDGKLGSPDTVGAKAVDTAADRTANAPDTAGAKVADAATDGKARAPDTAGAKVADAAADRTASLPDTAGAKVVDAAADRTADAPATGVAKVADAAPDGTASAPDTGGANAVEVGAKASDLAVSWVDSGGDGPLSGLFLTVTTIGGGVGTVTSSPAGIRCGANCSAAFATSPILLSALATNGSDSRFAGWSGACSGLTRDCTLVLGSSTTVTARFEPIEHNLVFVSSLHTYNTDLGSATAYDVQCNQLATAAGINNVTGDAFIAWVSDSQSLALSRLGTARGFMRMDGEPVADDPAAMLADSQFYNPINIDETGTTPFGALVVLTGMDPYGNGTDCDDWTAKSGSATGTAGCDTCGPPTWYRWQAVPCGHFPGSVYCFMKTKTAALTIAPQLGHRVFLTNGPVTIGQSADAQCESAKPSGTGPVAALRATTTTAASTLIDPTLTYVRPDGIVVGLGADLVSGKLKSGIWQQGNGQYRGSISVWTGSSLPSEVGTSASTCSDWTQNTGAVLVGGSSGTDLGWWLDDAIPWTCASTYTWSYCIEK